MYNGGAINNLSQIPARFRLFGTGSGGQRWTIDNSGYYYGVYYGPNATIETKQNSQFFGSISGYKFNLKSNSGLHYDHDLSNMTEYDMGFGIYRWWEE